MSYFISNLIHNKTDRTFALIPYKILKQQTGFPANHYRTFLNLWVQSKFPRDETKVGLFTKLCQVGKLT
jgi:hypothetical protein